ncbi:hypothetical protein ACTI_21160 [Actinoplanes sp. OR16]|uniref:hypothetical protein n=1 Tax=Actinoplanes sp. OR16 TaxID=946334 RepID=UPI000F6BD1C6|nr:hypothetical protein [Actinoplanes sp. OR16]BBH65431.1 hypothetical protein ACTI_21160 [Actinoplanes sp. OR16]
MTGAEFDGVDLDLLADYIGGALIGTPDDERVAALVSEDPVWREAYQRLAPGMAAVGTMLRDLPAEPLPDDLAARLDSLFSTSPVTALPTQATAADAVGESAAAVPAKVLDLAEAQRARAAGGRPRRMMRWAAPISVAAAVLAFAGFGLSRISDGDSASDAGSAESAGGGSAPMVAMAPAIGEILQSGFDYDRVTLAQPSGIAGSKRTFSEAPLIASAEASNDQSTGAAGSDPLSRLLEPAALAECLEAIARENGGGAVTVDTVDYASYTGVPALIVRFTAPNGGWAWAVGADCGTPGGDADTLEKLPVR